MNWRKGVWGIVAVATAGLTGTTTLLGQDREWEETTPYYEDDAWYDISEWFDGNDYNPTDEEIGIINDEVYDFGRNDVDFDNDRVYDYDFDRDYAYDDYLNDYGFYGGNYEVFDYDDAYPDNYDYGWTWYGYDEYDDDDWFYDWYDDGYATWYDWNDDGIFDTRYRYFDYDDDGYYDALLTQYDFDDDGIYEESDFDTFSDSVTSAQEDRARDTADEESRERQVSGTVRNVKTVSLKNSDNVVVLLSPESGERLTVDLGPEEHIEDLDIQSGDRLKATGPMTRIGGKRVLIANSLTVDGDATSIDRNTRQTQGTITSTREVRARDGRHLLAILEKDGDRLAVDLGDVGSARDLNLEEGDEVTVSGPRVKIGDRTILMAHQVRQDGRTHEIARTTTSDNSQTASQQRRDEQSRQTERKPGRVVGKITMMRKVKVRDSRRQVAQIRTDRGNTVVVDLGPAEEFDADVQPGDEIEARGALTRSGETSVLVATRVKADDQTLEIPSSRSDRERRQRREVSGEIIRLRNVKVRDERRRIATIETDEGQKIAVDLGARDRLEVDVNEGDTITVKGVLLRSRSGDRSMFVATRVTHDGETVTVARPFLGDDDEQEDVEESSRNRDRTRNRDRRDDE